MARKEVRRPSLPTKLLKQLGGDDPEARPGGKRRGTSRKDLRKAERSQKKQQQTSAARQHAIRQDESSSPAATRRQTKVPDKVSTKPTKERSPREHEVEEPDDFEDFSGIEHEGDDDNFDLNEDELEDDRQLTKPGVSKKVKDKLAQEDAEIAELERKLGMKKRKTLPKSFQEDGLGELLGDLAGEDDGDDVDEASGKRKRKAEADEWLAQKRRKAMPKPAESDDDAGEEDSESGDFNEDDDSEGDSNDDDCGDLDDNSEAEEEPARVRENPYVAPTPVTVQKYVPPARRQESGSDAELLSRIRRQAQGLINRLTEANLVAILGDIEKLYQKYPRQHVTSILVDLVLVQICEPTSLPDTLLILNAGLSTAVYKIVGSDFGAQLLQQAVEKFKEYYAQAPVGSPQNVTKHTSNLITFLSEIYNFQLIGCKLIFDYVRFLLDDLSELNAELLLRIVRMGGPSLRRDDPLALKDIVAMIRPAVTKVGEANLSVRTKFMIETINDLKNNKLKAGLVASAVNSQHTTRMRKLLGTLNTRKLKATEPLNIDLKDIEESDKRGKWWLVGASWAGRDGAPGKGQKKEEGEERDSEDDSIILDSENGDALPDLETLAREQGMNTDVRRAIYIAIMSADDYEDAYVRLTKLRLNKERRKEIAPVIMQCVGSEQQYNPYYMLVAKRLCLDGRIKFAFQHSLWQFFRRLGESTFGDDEDDDGGDEEDEEVDMRRIVNIGKMFGGLVANGSLTLKLLKCLSLAYLKPKTHGFVEVMLITIFLELPKDDEAAINKTFAAVADAPGLSKGLQYFLKKKISKTELVASKKDGHRVSKGCKVAIAALVVPGATTE